MHGKHSYATHVLRTLLHQLTELKNFSSLSLTSCMFLLLIACLYIEVDWTLKTFTTKPYHESDYEGGGKVEFSCCSNDSLSDDVAPHNTTENIDHDGINLEQISIVCFELNCCCFAHLGVMILKSSFTWLAVAPPPTSRKLAGLPPWSLIMSMVRPALLTMHPMSPSRAM